MTAAWTLDFLGATHTVTGSKFLLTTPSGAVLVDCGLYQGLGALRRRNWEPFPVAPSSIDAVVVSHAHLDHSGYVPALVREGFAGPVVATDSTAELAAIVLRDSAHLLMEDAQHARERGYSRHREPQPLYTDADVEVAVRRFQPARFGVPVSVNDLSVTLSPAGHVLGSSTVHLAMPATGRSIVFSGDLGRRTHPLLSPPTPPPDADVVVVESTYGDRHHPTDDGTNALAGVINRTVDRGGSVVIPAFAVDRTEMILMSLRELRRSRAIGDVPIYVDSPMALTALEVYRRAVHDGAVDVRPELRGDDELFDPGNLHELRTVEESKSLNDPQQPGVIVSASGMATGGRVLHHLAGLLPGKENSVVLAGFQAEGTRGRQLLDGARALKIHGRYVPVNAEVVEVPTFSAHADSDEIIQWLGQAPRKPDTCFIVHGELSAATAVQGRIAHELGWTAVVPQYRERVRID